MKKLVLRYISLFFNGLKALEQK